MGDLTETLDPVWRAFHLDEAAEALGIIIVHPRRTDLTREQSDKRESLMRVAKKLIELERDRSLKEAYEALRVYLQDSAGAVPVLHNAEVEVGIRDADREGLGTHGADH